MISQLRWLNPCPPQMFTGRPPARGSVPHAGGMEWKQKKHGFCCSGPSNLIWEITSKPNKNPVSFCAGAELSGMWASWLVVPARDLGGLHGALREATAFPSKSEPASCALGTPHLLSQFVLMSVPGKMELLPHFSGKETGPRKLRHSPGVAQLEHDGGRTVAHALASMLQSGFGWQLTDPWGGGQRFRAA